MSLCTLLKRSQRFDPSIPRPNFRELDLCLRSWNRGRHGLLTDDLVREFLEEACERALRPFLNNYRAEIQALSDRLDAYLAPIQCHINDFLTALKDKDCDEAPEYLLSAIVDFFEWLSPAQIEQTLTELFDILYEEMEAGISALFDELIEPAIDEAVAFLESDFAGGLNDSSAFNRYMLAKDLARLKEALLEVGDEIAPYTRERYLDPVLAFVRNSVFFGNMDKLREVVGSSKEVVDKLLALIRAVSANASAEGAGPGRYRWYASWLLEKNFWEIDGKNCEGPLFSLDPNDHLAELNAAVSETVISADLHGDFDDQVAISTGAIIRQETLDEKWTLKDPSTGGQFYLIRRNGNGKIKVYRIFPEADWTRIPPMAGYTFKTIDAETAEQWAYHTSWAVDMTKMILHALSMEPTAATGAKSDALGNLGNLLLHLTYGGIKLSGPKGCGWNQTDANLNNLWANSVAPFLTTMIASLEGIHRNGNPNTKGARFTYWLSLAGKDFTEKYLIDHWCKLLRDGLLSYITVVNYDGPRLAVQTQIDPRPHNRKRIHGLAALSSELSAWLTVATFPKSWYGFPGKANEDHGRSVLAHWLGAGATLAVAGTFFGVKIAGSVGRVEDTKELCKSLKRGMGGVLTKFPLYLYLANEGSTNRGRISHAGAPMSGYPDLENSPYHLPYPDGEVYQCVQGNMGLWSHHAVSEPYMIYAYDFALDFGDEVAAARSGIVWSFVDDRPNDTDTENNWDDTGNYIRILHTGAPLEGQDVNLQKVTVPTFAEYRHGTAGSIAGEFSNEIAIKPVVDLLGDSAVKTQFLTVNVDLQALYDNDPGAMIAVKLDAPGGAPVGPVMVNQGDVIMRAGNTGKVAFNQLHLHVQPAELDAGGKVIGPLPYSIPFVFKEVGARLFGRAGVPRSGHYYESGNS